MTFVVSGIHKPVGNQLWPEYTATVLGPRGRVIETRTSYDELSLYQWLDTCYDFTILETMWTR